LDRLTKGERIVAVAAGLLIIFSRIELWASYTITNAGESNTDRASVWDPDVFGILPKAAIVLAIAMLAVVVFRAFGGDVPRTVNLGAVYLAGGAIATLLLLITAISGPRDLTEQVGLPELEQFEELMEQIGVIEIDQSRGILLFVGVILAAAVTYGGLLHARERGVPGEAPVDPSSPPPTL